MPSTSGTVANDLCNAPTQFGEAMFRLRTRSCLSQRELARRARIAPSIVSETENDRRGAPTPEKLDAICAALTATDSERALLHRLAAIDRQARGLKVGRTTPRHVADLLREIARMAPNLSHRQVAAIRTSLREAAAM
jgi:transcriptional regulator with XRE-family HTH domain